MNINLLNLIKNINISNIISGTNKSLTILKKSIPVYKEIRPYINHEKSIFKNEINTVDEIKESKPIKIKQSTVYNDSLTFFQ